MENHITAADRDLIFHDNIDAIMEAKSTRAKAMDGLTCPIDRKEEKCKLCAKFNGFYPTYCKLIKDQVLKNIE